MKPIFSLRFLPCRANGSLPSNETTPEFGRATPAMAFSKELFPAPFRPMTATISPAKMVAEIPLRAFLLSYATVSLSNEMTDSVRWIEGAEVVTASICLICVVILRISRTVVPISFMPNALARCTMGGAMGDCIRISSGVPTFAAPSPLI